MWIDIQQNSDEWLDLRAGKVTGSAVSKIMANYGKSFGEPAKKLAIQIAVERVTGKRIQSDGYSNAHMDRGHEQEPIARMLYEDETFSNVENGGFFDNDQTGCSPDGLVDTDGVIEIKSVIAPVHFATIKRDDVDPSYKWQYVFNLRETERDWIDFVSYCADFPEDSQLFIKRKTADEYETEIQMIDTRLIEFFNLVDDCENTIRLAA